MYRDSLQRSNILKKNIERRLDEKFDFEANFEYKKTLFISSVLLFVSKDVKSWFYFDLITIWSW